MPVEFIFTPAEPENAGAEQAHKVQPQSNAGQFKPGQSGNPAGRSKGCKNRATLAAEALLDGEAERLTRKAVELALDGDQVALRLCLERILPPRRGRYLCLDLPRLQSADDLPVALGRIARAVGRGELALDDAERLASLLELERRAIETADLARDVEALKLHAGLP